MFFLPQIPQVRLSRLATLLSALCLSACVTTHDVVETGPYGTACIDPASIVHREYWEASLNRYEVSAEMSFSVPGYASHAARVSYTLYLADHVAAAVRDYAAAHPGAVTPAVGGLKKVDGWYDPARTSLRHPVLVSAPKQGWFLVEPRLLAAGDDAGFLLECRAGAGTAECIRHIKVADRNVEISMDAADMQHWAEADMALRTALQSLLAPCIP